MFDWLKSVKIKSTDSTSKAFTLDLTDAKKLGIDALIVGAGAGVAYFISHIAGLNFGDATALIVPILTVGLNLVYKWLKENHPENREGK